jgi:tetratricopeptide (TPR) repeat protein
MARNQNVSLLPQRRLLTNSDFIKARFRQGLALHQQGSTAEAERIYEEILKQSPTHFDAQHCLGVVALQTRRFRRGVELFTKAIELNSNVADAHNNLGYALDALKRHEEALASYDKAIALKPDFAEAHNNRGNILNDLERQEEALANYDKAIALNPDFVEAHNNRGNTLDDLERHEEALASYDKAVALNPHYAEAYNNRGNVLNRLNRNEEALASYDKAVALRPDFPRPLYNRGNALLQLNRLDEALATYDRAVAIKPDYAAGFSGRGGVFMALKRYEEAQASYNRARELLIADQEASLRAMASLPSYHRAVREVTEVNSRRLRNAVDNMILESAGGRRDFRLTEDCIRELNRIATAGLLKRPGRYRKEQIILLADSTHVPPNWEQIPALMTDYCRYVNDNLLRGDVINLCAFILWRLVWIHPFLDGNGRVSRSITHAVFCIRNRGDLSTHQSLMEQLSHNSVRRKIYISKLESAHRIFFQTRNTDKALRPIEQWLRDIMSPPPSSDFLANEAAHRKLRVG